jgi:hypothetical protein
MPLRSPGILAFATAFASAVPCQEPSQEQRLTTHLSSERPMAGIGSSACVRRLVADYRDKGGVSPFTFPYLYDGETKVMEHRRAAVFLFERSETAVQRKNR